MRRLRILYVADLGPGGTARHRGWALSRLGHEVRELDIRPFYSRASMMHKIQIRTQAGPLVAALNRQILAASEEFVPDVVWFDKVLGLWPETIDRLRARGRLTVDYMIDNCFGPIPAPGWRLYRKCIGHHDLHVTQRASTVKRYQDIGARSVMKVQTAFEPTLHFPPKAEWTDRDRNRWVSFIGSPYDERCEILCDLKNRFNLQIDISGNLSPWRKKMKKKDFQNLFRSPNLIDDEYRIEIWKSRINLAFLTSSDEFSHKAFEIAACGGFLLAEDAPGHRERFEDGKEAVFFGCVEDLADKARFYLPRESLRRAIADAGRARAVTSGYDNDTQLARVIAALDGD